MTHFYIVISQNIRETLTTVASQPLIKSFYSFSKYLGIDYNKKIIMSTMSSRRYQYERQVSEHICNMLWYNL